jgi:predicted KAP-like P-loop ATPase
LLPLSLGVFGGWGVGKSSTLRLVETELMKTPKRYLVIKFDAWLYPEAQDHAIDDFTLKGIWAGII